MSAVSPELRIAAIPPFVMMFAMTGRASEDRRLTDDKQSCRSMGHLSGSTAFNLCMKELNERRCDTIHQKRGDRHMATTGCTRL